MKPEELDLSGNPFEISMDKERFRDVLNDVEEVDGFKDYLRETMMLDMKRYFLAPKEQQDSIRGAFNRTQYLLNVLIKISDEKVKKSIDNK